MSKVENLHLVLFGDSDIAFWPEDLYPAVPQLRSTCKSGHSGATLRDLIPQLSQILQEQGEKELLLVICAGENDIGEGLSQDNSVSALDKLLGMILTSSEKHMVIFLGPKFEPWQENDVIAKKRYSKMSRSFERCLSRQGDTFCTHYIDCLTMFCGESATAPGAILGGRAKAEFKYFQSDLLHLSIHGYKIWKEVVEQKIMEILAIQTT